MVVVYVYGAGCYAYWCPPCYWCTLASRMDEYYCGPHWFPCGCFELFRVAMRTKLRTMHGIRVRISVQRVGTKEVIYSMLERA